MWPGGVLDARVRRCAARGARLIVDEVARGTLDAGAGSVCVLRSFASGAVIAIGDVSKSFGLGGLRIGWLTCADPALVSRAAALKDLTSLGPAAPSELLAAIALEHRAELGRAVTAAASANRHRLRRWVARVDDAWFAEPEDGLVAFPRLPGAIDDLALAARLRAKHDVGVVPGSFFGDPGHVRVGLAERPQRFAAGLYALGAALRESRTSAASQPLCIAADLAVAAAGGQP